MLIVKMDLFQIHLQETVVSLLLLNVLKDKFSVQIGPHVPNVNLLQDLMMIKQDVQAKLIAGRKIRLSERMDSVNIAQLVISLTTERKNVFLLKHQQRVLVVDQDKCFHSIRKNASTVSHSQEHRITLAFAELIDVLKIKLLHMKEHAEIVLKERWQMHGEDNVFQQVS